MRLEDTAEGPTDPVGALVNAEQSLGLDNLAFAVDPLGLYRIEPGTLGRVNWRAQSGASWSCLRVTGPCSPGQMISPRCSSTSHRVTLGKSTASEITNRNRE